VPYTPQELALFQRPEINLTEATVKSAKKSVKELPPGSAALVVQAQRDFAAHDMDKAEAKYLQVLRQDEKNGAVLANLAAIQLEMNRRIGILCLLYNARRSDEDNPGISILDLEKIMGFPREHLTFTLWYLRDRKYVANSQNSDYAITSDGIDYVEEHLPTNRVAYKLLKGAEDGTARMPNEEPEPRAPIRTRTRQGADAIVQ